MLMIFKERPVSIKNREKKGIKKSPCEITTGGDKEEAKMLTQNTKLAFRKHKPPKTFNIQR